jgi:thiol-disulfide isomerase/thioredoxin
MARQGFTGTPTQWEKTEKVIGTSTPKVNFENWANSQGQPNTRGKVVIVHFFESSSVGSNTAVPQTNKLAQKYNNGRNALVMGANTRNMTPAQRQEYVQKQGIQYPLGYMSSNSGRNWNLQYKPTYGVMDQNGTVVALGVNADYAERIADALLGGQTASQPSGRR